MDSKIIAITGHRPNKLGNDYELVSPLTKWIRSEIVSILKTEKPDKGISGMALGIDTLYALILLELNIPLIAALPCRRQEKVWPQRSQDLYWDILSKASETVYVTDGAYTKECMQKRNEYMVDRCNKLIGVWDGTSGGTKNCIQYAKKVDRPILRINPKKYYEDNESINKNLSVI